MSKLDFNAPLDEISRQCMKLTIGSLSSEITRALDDYIESSRNDYRLKGERTDGTRHKWNIYRHLVTELAVKVNRMANH